MKETKQKAAASSEKEENRNVQEALEGFRRNIDAIDEQIVSLLEKRQSEVVQVVALKKKHNLPIYHPAREEDLISKRRDQGREAGLNPDFIEEVYRGILRQSRMKQTVHMARKGVLPGGNLLIVGGRGGMGRFFHRYFAGAGYNVRLLNRDDWPRVEELCEGIDMAMISVPIDTTCDIIRRIGPYLPPKAVLTDITSVKKKPLEAMLSAHPGPVIGLHPIFGPTTSTLDKQIVVATPGRDDEACAWLLEQFIAWGSIVIRSDPDEHDEIMAIVQSLRHFATFGFGQFLCEQRVDLQRSLEFSSPIYRLEIGMVGRLFAQDPLLYSEIIFASAQRRELLKEYIASLNRNLEMLENGDKDYFHAEFEKIAEWFGPFSEQSMRESTFLIDKLIERF